MFELLGLILGGGATGLLGTGMSLLFGWLKDRGERSERLEQRRLDIEHDRVEFESRERVADREATRDEITSADALQRASYEHDKAAYSTGTKLTKAQNWLMVVVDLLRGIIRPALTIILLWCIWDTRTEVMAVIEQSSIGNVIPTAKALEIYRELVSTIMYLGTTCVSWWFGDRMVRRTRG